MHDKPCLCKDTELGTCTPKVYHGELRFPHLDELVGHADVLRIDTHVLGRRHGHERHRALVAEVLVGPRADAADELHRRNAVVGHQHAAKAQTWSAPSLRGRSGSWTECTVGASCGGKG